MNFQVLDIYGKREDIVATFAYAHDAVLFCEAKSFMNYRVRELPSGLWIDAGWQQFENKMFSHTAVNVLIDATLLDWGQDYRGGQWD